MGFPVMSNADNVAQGLEQKKGFKFSAAYVWGGAPFRPDDEVYELLGAKADGDRVDVRTLNTSADPSIEVVISIFGPGKLKVTEDELRISSATRVLFGPTDEYVAQGDSFRVMSGDVFPRGSKPALRLVIAPY